MDNGATYKARQEAFVTGLAGSTLSEAVALLIVLPACALLHRAVLGCAAAVGGAASPRRWSTPLRFAVEFVLLVLPALLNLTALAGHALATAAAAVGGAVVLHVVTSWAYGRVLLSVSDAPDAAAHLLARQRRKAFVNSFRAGMMLSTCVARARNW